MAHRDNDRRRYRDDDRYRDRDNERYYRQADQFEADSYGQLDYREDRFNDSFGSQMGERDYDRNGNERGYSRSPARSWGGRRETDCMGQSEYRSSFGPSRYDTGEGRGFSSFTANDQAGADFAAGNRRPYGGYGAGIGGLSGGYASGSYDTTPRRGYSDSYEDRGFLERAGDEVASWFGDEDAARRRRQDHHRGRGPTNYTRSDERILEDACDALTDDWDVDARNVQVTVSNGEVTLDGTVDSRFGKRRAEDCVEDVSGVKHVQNNLRVSDRDYGSDTTYASGSESKAKG